MSTFSELFPGDPALYAQVWKKDPGAYVITVPEPAGWDGVSPVYFRAIARGCGGQGDHWGGGGAYARTNGTAMPGETLLAQVGNVATASTPGDSWVKRANGQPIVYADRGRGNGNGGRAANSIGDVTGSGAGGGGTLQHGGQSASDAASFAALDAGSLGYDNTGSGFVRAADFGGGGFAVAGFNESNLYIEFYALGAGSGVVVIGFYTADPLY